MAEKRRKPAPVSPCHCLGWDIPSLILCHSQTGTHPASFPGRPACGRQVVEPLRSSFLHLRAWCAVVDMLSQCKQQEPHSHRLDQHPDFPWHTLGRPEHRGRREEGEDGGSVKLTLLVHTVSSLLWLGLVLYVPFMGVGSHGSQGRYCSPSAEARTTAQKSFLSVRLCRVWLSPAPSLETITRYCDWSKQTS